MNYGWFILGAIALGSGLGGALRYVVSLAMDQRLGEWLPWGTLTVNVLGSFIIGLLVALTESGSGDGEEAGKDPPVETLDPHQHLLLPFMLTGFCGGFTTFSTFSIQTLKLLHAQRYQAAGLNVGLGLVCCLIGVAFGFYLGQVIRQRGSN